MLLRDNYFDDLDDNDRDLLFMIQSQRDEMLYKLITRYIEINLSYNRNIYENNVASEYNRGVVNTLKDFLSILKEREAKDYE